MLQAIATSIAPTHLEDVLHLEAPLGESLHGQYLRQRYITDGTLAFRLGVAERLGRQPKVALLEVPPAEPLPTLGPLRHHPGREGEGRKGRDIRHWGNYMRLLECGVFDVSLWQGGHSISCISFLAKSSLNKSNK